MDMLIQWKLSNQDTLGTEETVLMKREFTYFLLEVGEDGERDVHKL